MRRFGICTLFCLSLLIVWGFRPNFSQASQPSNTPTQCSSGSAGVYPCESIDLLAHMPLDTLGAGVGEEGSDLWGWTDMRDGREYALSTLTDGVAFVDITNPLHPIHIATLPTATCTIATCNAFWRDVKVYADHAFVVADKAQGHGMQIVDLQQLRDVTQPPITLTANAYYTGSTSAHNVVINEESGYAYIVGSDGGSNGSCNGGLHIVNIQTPTAPQFVSCFSDDGYTHDAQCVMYNGPDTAYANREICFAANEDTVTIVDVTDHANPVQLSRRGYGGAAYTHQGWLTEDHAYLLVNDEKDERDVGHNTRTYIFDVRDLDNPQLLNQYDGPTGAIDHNIYVHEGLVYEANYQAGLRILDGSGIASGVLTETASFDIFPTGDLPSFNGAWSSYPFYESGVVTVNGIEQGLFTLRPQFEASFRPMIHPSRLARCGDTPLDVTLYVEQIAGFAAPVSIAAVAHPSGLTLTPVQASQMPDSSQTLALASTNAPVGTYSLAVRGISGPETYSTTLLVHQLAAIDTVAPASGASAAAIRPAFSWTQPAGGTYRLEVATDAEFSNVVIDVMTAAGSYQPPTDLMTGTDYFWRVSAETGLCATATSPTATFTTSGSAPLATTLTAQSAGIQQPLALLALLLTVALTLKTYTKLR